MAGGAGHGQHIVQRHRDVGDQDLYDRLVDRAPVSTSGMMWLLSWEISRHMRQQTQSSRMPPASNRPMIAKSCARPPAAQGDAQDHSRDQAQEDDFLRRSAGTRAAARPITMALSPASTHVDHQNSGQGRANQLSVNMVVRSNTWKISGNDSARQQAGFGVTLHPAPLPRLASHSRHGRAAARG